MLCKVQWFTEQNNPKENLKMKVEYSDSHNQNSVTVQ